LYADVTFLLDADFIEFIGADYEYLTEVARTELSPTLSELISEKVVDGDAYDAEEFFEADREALQALEKLFPHDKIVISHVQEAYAAISDAIEEANSNSTGSSDDGWTDGEEDQFSGGNYEAADPPNDPNSVFDDIDE
jgi:hypothetical protein